MKLSVALALVGVCAACGGGGTQGGAAPAAAVSTAPAETAAATVSAPAAPAFREITLPAGTPLRLELKSSVASDSSKVEDAVRGTLREAVRLDGQQVLPAGTEVSGTVTGVDRSGRVKGRAVVSFRFDSLAHAGERYPIKTAVIARQAEATKGEDAKKIGIGAGAGAALGAILGGGDGAAKGAAIGGAGGTGVVLATRGKEVRLGPGADVNTKLTSPVTIRVRL